MPVDSFWQGLIGSAIGTVGSAFTIWVTHSLAAKKEREVREWERRQAESAREEAQQEALRKDAADRKREVEDLYVNALRSLGMLSAGIAQGSVSDADANEAQLCVARLRLRVPRPGPSENRGYRAEFHLAAEHFQTVAAFSRNPVRNLYGSILELTTIDPEFTGLPWPLPDVKAKPNAASSENVSTSDSN